jgi:hypothetical protein
MPTNETPKRPRLQALLPRGKQSGSRRYICVTQVVPQKLCARSPFALECVVRKLGKILYSTPLTPNLWRICLLTFAGKVTFGSVRATSAIDPSMLWFTGVAIKAWMLPASGPL